ncbi:basic proline-rich protein-like, partial [Mustela lutreola]|uniref:basic proline-rich protein-like n=1 Tax=Mustela lutreola TaxID=9666 RepID=UPI0027976CF1
QGFGAWRANLERPSRGSESRRPYSTPLQAARKPLPAATRQSSTRVRGARGDAPARARGERGARPRERGRVAASASARVPGRGCVGWGASEAAAAPQSRRDARASRRWSRRLRRRPWASGPRRESSACRLPGSGAAGRVPRAEWSPPQETRRDTGLSRGDRGRPDRSNPSGRPGWGLASGQVPPSEGRPGARRPPARHAGRARRRGRPCSPQRPPRPRPEGRSPRRAPPSRGPARPERREPGKPAPAVAARPPGSRGEEGGETLPFIVAFSP